MSEMLQQLVQAKEEAKHTAVTGEGGNPNGQNEELSEKAPELEARQENAEAAEEAPEAASAGSAKEETLIRIGDQTFKSEREAIAYAEQLERDRFANDAYNQGVREALQSQAQNVKQPEPEDNFEERFYANPKETLKEVQAKARDEAVALIRAENQREALWNQFLGDNPDLRRKDAQRVLDENWETLGRMTDLTKAMKILAQKTRAEYEEIRDLGKPRTELSNKSGQVVSPSGGAPRGVTPKKEEGPIDFISQMKKLKTHA